MNIFRIFPLITYYMLWGIIQDSYIGRQRLCM